MLENIKNYRLVLASKSPRRKELLSQLGLYFDVETIDTNESFPPTMPVAEVAHYLAVKKAVPFQQRIGENDLVITADTIVAIENDILGKPTSYNEAVEMLRKLSGKTHVVFTGVCLTSMHKSTSFTSATQVHFKKLTSREIDYYITHYHPYDKAGAYGIQEWIGYIAVEKIEGSYFNVMGLPVQHLYEELCGF
jgi:septum formation protein